jgi:hypothetical protein
MTELLIVPFGSLGALFGGAYGFSQSLSERNGVVWRPTMGAACGGVMGLTIGLFPYQTFGLLLVVDGAYSVFHALEKR